VKIKWIHKLTPEREKIESFSQELNNLNPLFTTLLLQRNIDTYSSAKSFFNPAISDLHNPFLMKGMNLAVARLQEAIQNKEKILLYGDYDVDGTTSVALVYCYLSSFYPHCECYIPNRNTEGYGISETGLEWAEENNITLIVALDLGIKEVTIVEKAREKGIDIIICDHHEPGDKVPLAVAVLDPKQIDCPYPFKELSGCGLGFKFMQALSTKYNNENVLFQYIDLVAVSIASDLVAINGENRLLAYFGLKKLNENPTLGLKVLKTIVGATEPLDITDVVFKLGPVINAAGRMEHGSNAVKLLVAKSEKEAKNVAKELKINNFQRRYIDKTITDQAIKMIESDPSLLEAKTTVLYNQNWHKGIVGIVASRCIESYYRPTIILCQSNSQIVGSARGVRDFNLYSAIEKCKDLLLKFGGHRYAAGLTLESKNLSAFKQRFEKIVSETISEDQLTPTIDIDLTIDLDVLTPKFIENLMRMAPFGPENPKPIFEAKGLSVKNSITILKEKHLRFEVCQEGKQRSFKAIGFGKGFYFDDLSQNKKFSLAFTVEESTFRESKSIQLNIKDIKFDNKL